MSAIDDARDDLLAQYSNAHQIPVPIVGVNVGTYEERPVLRIFVHVKSKLFVPNESKPGIGFQGFECVSFLGPNTLISDSGPIS